SFTIRNRLPSTLTGKLQPSLIAHGIPLTVPPSPQLSVEWYVATPSLTAQGGQRLHVESATATALCHPQPGNAPTLENRALPHHTLCLRVPRNALGSNQPSSPRLPQTARNRP